MPLHPPDAVLKSSERLSQDSGIVFTTRRLTTCGEVL